MPLTKADKQWLRRMTRAVLAEVIASEASTQMGGYDGATDAMKDDWAEESRRRGRRHRIGFDTGTTRKKAK